MATKLLTVPYFRQDRMNYCGAACMQMVIGSLGGPSLDQDDLYLDAHANGAPDPPVIWFSPPDGIEETLDNVGGLPPDFDLTTTTSEATLTRRIVWSIYNASVAPIALVYGNAHWVVVVGYDVTKHPKGVSDTSYTIQALEIHNPWRSLGEGNPPPPPPPKHVTYSWWTFKYLKPVPSGNWSGKRLAVGEFAAARMEPEKLVAEPKITGGASTGAPIIVPEEAKKGASIGIERYGLRAREDWAPLLEPPVTAGEPVLVELLSEPGFFYYVVPFSASDRKVEAGVIVDAFTGEYLEASPLAAHTDGRPWTRLIKDAANNDLSIRSLVGRRFELPDNAGRVLVRPQNVGLYPTLVWRPCLESLSPFYPFRLATIGDMRRFMSIDGFDYAELHDAGPGG
jgi:hypothetical protein